MSIRSVETFQQVYAKLEWAEKQVLDLEELWSRCRQKYPVKGKLDRKTGKYVYRLMDAPPLPIEVKLIAGDCIHNLRSALDHLAYRLVCVSTNSIGPFDDVNFPVGDSPKIFKSKLKAIKKRLKPAAIKMLKQIEAYPRGRGKEIWQLHRLNNIDKHRLLLTVTSQNRSRSSSPKIVAGHRRDFLGMSTVPTSRDYRLFQTGITPKINLKAGDILDTIDKADVQPKMYFPIEIAFNEPEIFKDNPVVIQTIQGMMSAVRVVIRDFDFANLLD